MITDAQVHLWEADRLDRPMAPGTKPHLPEPMTAERMLGLMDEAGIDRAVISPTNLPDRSPVYAQEVVAKYPMRFRVMGWFRVNRKEHFALLPRWLEQPGMCSLRLALNEPDEEKAFADGALEPVWKSALDLQMPVAIWRRAGNGIMEAVLKKYPDMIMIIDHLNWTKFDDERERKMQELESLARFKNVHVKVSSLPLLSSGAAPEYEDLHPLIRRVHSAYGAQRLMWGSDQTQVMGRNRGTYAQNADIVRKYAAQYLPAEDIQWMMHGTAAKVFNWPAG